MKTYSVYIMTNRSRTLYTGMTNNLARRIQEHKSRQTNGFVKKYSIDQLVYYEEFNDPNEAITREKQIKGWLRIRKIQLIESVNPMWEDVSDEILEY